MIKVSERLERGVHAARMERIRTMSMLVRKVMAKCDSKK